MLKPYVIPPEIFSELAQGRGGTHAGHWLVNAERSKHILLIRSAVDVAVAAGHKQARDAVKGYNDLAAMQRIAPAAVEAVIRHPAVGAWALDTIRHIHQGEHSLALPAHINSLVAGAAIRAHVPLTISLPIIDGTIVIPSVGRAFLPESCADESATVSVNGTDAELIAGATRVRIPPEPSDDVDGWQGMRVLNAICGDVRLRLVIDDIDPYRFPPSATLGMRLDSTEARRWEAVLQDAWDLLVRHHPRTASELSSVITTFTPLLRDTTHTSNATSRITFGCIALSPPRDSQSLALTLAHEVQHAKLAALTDLVGLVRPDANQLYYAPWRDDPRPAGALLQGTYAHLGVANFCRVQRHLDSGPDNKVVSHTDYVRWRDATAEAAATLSTCTDLTALGKEFVEGIHETLRTWRQDRVPILATKLARKEAEEHRSRWAGALRS